MKPKVIKNDNDHQKYLNYIESVFHKDLSESEANDVEIISLLIDNYEKLKLSEISTIEEQSSIDYIYNLVGNVSPIEKSQDICRKGLKLNEEVGELSAEILKLVNYKYHNETEKEIRDNLLYESADSLIQIFDILVSLGYTKEELIDAAEKKINTWLYKINQK